MSRSSSEETTSGLENLNDVSDATETREPTSSDPLLMRTKEPSTTMKKERKTLASQDNDNSALLYSIFKKVCIVVGVYLIGYMGWSIAWLITPIVLAVTREYYKKAAGRRHDIAKALAEGNEKEIITARISDLPAWVYFPDVERCEWINRILQQIWPNANHFAYDLLKKVVEPKIEKALANYKKGFKFDRIVLGRIPPCVGGAKVYDKNVSRNEIILDVNLIYASDCDISFLLAGMKAGIKNFQIRGMLRIIMKPLIPKMPLVGGLQIFFLSDPDIDFNLVGVADVLDLPGLSDILRRTITEQISSIMVLPNKLPIALSKEVPAMILRMPEPEGVLRIHVIEARNLMRKDISVLGKGKSDPYAKISVGKTEFQTKTITNTVNPVWRYSCEVLVLAEGQSLHINLFDSDDTGDDDKLGSVTVEISNIVKNGTVDKWFHLKEARHGEIHLRLSWLNLTDDAAYLQAPLEETKILSNSSLSTAVLSIYIDSASDLPPGRGGSKPDPYVTLAVGAKKEETKIEKRTDIPVWEQGFIMLVGNPEHDKLELKIKDKKTDRDLGEFSYPLNTLLSKPNLELVSQPFQLQKANTTSSITLSLKLRILKRAPRQGDDSIVYENASNDNDSPIDNESPYESSEMPTPKLAPFPLSTRLAEFPEEYQNTNDSGIQDSIPLADLEKPLLSSPTRSVDTTDSINGRLTRVRRMSTTSSAGIYGLGRIQITLRYNIPQNRLIVIIHKIVNIQMKENSIPDPYVKLYLLPGRAKETKRKTMVVKDSCNPVYDVPFDYFLSPAELSNTELEVTVATQKGFLSGGSPVIGMVKIPLDDPDSMSQQGTTFWYDLLPESKFE